MFMILLLAACSSDDPGQEESIPEISEPWSEPEGPSIDPDNPPMVSLAGFESLEVGMNYREVVEIFGREGVLIGEQGSLGAVIQIYMWPGETGSASGVFQNGRLIEKTQFGLE